MRYRLGAMSAVVVVLALSVFGQTSQPTSAPTTQANSPKGALKTFAVALDAGDGAALGGLIYSNGPIEQKMAGAMVDMAVAMADLNRALVDKFGKDQSRAVVGDTDGQLKQSLATIDGANEKIDGNSAVVSIGASPQGMMTLKKVDGTWKISLADQAKGLSPEQVDQVITMVSGQLKQLKDVTGDINGGKFATANDVATALRGKMGGAPQTAPASQPVDQK